jgi:ribosomal protein L19E
LTDGISQEFTFEVTSQWASSRRSEKGRCRGKRGPNGDEMRYWKIKMETLRLRALRKHDELLAAELLGAEIQEPAA